MASDLWTCGAGSRGAVRTWQGYGADPVYYGVYSGTLCRKDHAGRISRTDPSMPQRKLSSVQAIYECIDFWLFAGLSCREKSSASAGWQAGCDADRRNDWIFQSGVFCKNIQEKDGMHSVSVSEKAKRRDFLTKKSFRDRKTVSEASFMPYYR